MNEYYGTIVEAANYFANRLHEHAWSESTPTDRVRGLIAATRVIDQLNFKGCKASVYALKQTTSCPTDDEIRDAEASQALEFPRGADISVPLVIRLACYEIAHSLLDGKDPEIELENLGITTQGVVSVRTTYNRDTVPVEHLVNHIPSSLAWRWLKPFLRDGDAIRLSRV